MDSSTRRVLQAVNEYLDDVEGRQHQPIPREAVEALQSASKTITHSYREPDPSPGQQAAAEAASAVLEKVTLDPEDSLSPGERAAAEAAS